MKMKLSLLIMAMVVFMGLFMFTGCGTTEGQDLESYMKEQTAARASVDAQLSVLSPEANGTVSYTSENMAEVTVKYFAMTDEEIEAIEPGKAEIRSKAILDPVLKQFTRDTGNKAEMVVTVEGKKVEQ